MSETTTKKGDVRVSAKPAVTPPRVALTRERILQTALALVDRSGLRSLSMRALGAELGVEAMSLYKHVPNKDAILDGMVAVALDEIDWETDRALPWQQRIEQAAVGFLQIGRAHPEVFPLLLSRDPTGDAVLRPVEAILAALDAAGLEPEEAVSVFWTLLSYVYGAVICEIGQSTSTDVQTLPLAKLEADGAFPFTQAAATHLSGCDLGDEFMAGVRRILAGSVSTGRDS